MAAAPAEPEKKCPPGLPAWLATFGDLMSLLLCFFVLLLSFATIDAKKMKEVVSGMDKAFGVQSEVIAHQTPMGTSIITDQFSPNVTKKTTKESVKQETTSTKEKILGKKRGAEGDREGGGFEGSDEEMLKREVEKNVQELDKALKLEIFIRSAEVEGQQEMVMIRLKDKAAFKTGKANLNRSILPALRKVATSLQSMKGRIMVIGHTDNIPISNEEFSSNWELSSRRATAVVHRMVEFSPELSSRIHAEGHGDIDPLADNRDPMGRSANRRVEIILRK